MSDSISILKASADSETKIHVPAQVDADAPRYQVLNFYGFHLENKPVGSAAMPMQCAT